MSDHVKNDSTPIMEQVQKMLQDEKMMENIKNFMSLLGNSNSSTHTPNNRKPVLNKPSNNNNPPPSMPINNTPQNINYTSQPTLDNRTTVATQIQNAYDKLTSTADPRIQLLLALKPFLKPQRAEKVDSAVKFVQMSKLPSVINEFKTNNTRTNNQ